MVRCLGLNRIKNTNKRSESIEMFPTLQMHSSRNYHPRNGCLVDGLLPLLSSFAPSNELQKVSFAVFHSIDEKLIFMAIERRLINFLAIRWRHERIRPLPIIHRAIKDEKQRKSSSFLTARTLRILRMS